MDRPDLIRRRVLRRSSLCAAAALADLRLRLPGLAAAGALGGSFRQVHAELEPDLSAPLDDAIELDSWIHIARGGTVTVLCNHAEMGQGITTALPMLIAEELEVPLEAIRVRIAPPAQRYWNPRFDRQLTGESASVRGMHVVWRQAGAQARDRLLRAAAARLGVDQASLNARDGAIHAADGRSASYGALAADAARLPAREVELKPREAFRLIGKPQPRLDTPAKINGSAVFGIDTVMPDMMHAAIRMAPQLDAPVRRFDARAARKMPGVLDVISIGDAVAVLAQGWWQAERAADKLTIDWGPSPNAGRSNDSIARAYLNALRDGKPIVSDSSGDLPGAMKAAARVHRAQFWSHPLAHATLEPMNFTAHWDGLQLKLIGPTQFPDRAQWAVAKALQLAPEQISVATTFIGCGLGRRVETDVEVQAAKIAYAVGKPVKLIWSREQDLTHDYYRPIALNSVEVGLDRDGWPIALDWTISSESIKARIWDWDPRRLDGTMVEYSKPPYRIANARFRAIHTPAGIRVGFMRSVSHAFNVFTNEALIDELALISGRDPLDYRLALLADGSRHKAVLNRVAELGQWRDSVPSGRSRGIALMHGYGSVLAMISEVSVSGSNVTLHRVSCAVDVGQAINPAGVFAQIESSVVFGMGACLMQKITFQDGRVAERNFDRYRLPRITDQPRIDVVLVESSAPPGGIGEPGAALIQASIVNAVSAAIGKRIRRLPIDLTRNDAHRLG